MQQLASQVDDQAVLSRIQQKIGPQKYNAWFRHGSRICCKEGYVQVSVPNLFAAHWIESHYRDVISQAAEQETGQAHQVLVHIDPALGGELKRGQLDLQADIVNKTAQGRVKKAFKVPVPLPAKHRFSEFAVGQSNKLAYSAAEALAGPQTPAFAQLFLHGPCGVGKTHLLQAICHAVGDSRRKGGPLKWRYVTGEQFTNEFVTALRKRQTDEFRARYRNLDLLAIDDVHFLAAKKATQEEFLHTFNAIQAAGKRVVLASDAHPHMVGELSEQLASRFVSGMVVRIDPPEQELRERILRKKIQAMRLSIESGVVEYIVHHVRGSIREMEGTVVKLAALSALGSGPIDLAAARDALADHLARCDGVVTLGDIESQVATYFGVTPADLHSSRRTRTISAARMVAMYLARQHTNMSFPEIARAMGKNHSTVVLAVQRLQKRLAAGEAIQWASPAGPKSVPAEELIQRLAAQMT